MSSGISSGGVLEPEKVILGPPLYNAINKGFGSLDLLIEEFNAKALALEGRKGWTWLLLNTETNDLEIRISTSDNRIEEDHLKPILVINI